MFNCKELEEYLDTPIRQRTPEQRNNAFAASYEMLIDWWIALQERNPGMPIMKSDTIEINIPNTITALIEKKNSFLRNFHSW